MHFDVLLKCWELPYSVSQHSLHCGSHSNLVGVLGRDPTFRKTMQACQSKVDLLFQEHDTVRVACGDSHGMYRSVAVATILQGVFEVKGYTTKGPYHIDKCKWKEKNICSNCRGCLPNNQKKQRYEKVASHW